MTITKVKQAARGVAKRSAKRATKAAAPRRIARSSGNVFADLGFGAEEAEHLRIRSALMATIRTMIQDRAHTQAKAASLLGVTQPRISDLMRGKIDLFSIDTLVDMLTRAGFQVDVRVAQAAEPAAV